MNIFQHNFKFYLFSLVFLLTILSISAREEKLLPFFAVVRIPTSACQTENGQSYGICYSKKQCRNNKGRESGTCASGYGVCCIVAMKEYSSDEPVKVVINGTHLINPSNPPNPNLRQYLFPKPKGVCQVRLDFIELILDQPNNLTHYCDLDTLTISGASNTNYLGKLCGNLTGQHVYLDYGLNSEIALSIYTATLSNQMWDIMVTYVKCCDGAPDGCLQYYTNPSGIVQSFNFYNMLQLNNEDYSVCIKRQNGMNQIAWTTCGGPDDFVISGQLPILPPPGVDLPPIYDPQSGDNCMVDWVEVFGVNKYCGNQFPVLVPSMTQPFMLGVHFDDQELTPPTGVAPDDRNTGFCLKYAQSP